MEHEDKRKIVLIGIGATLLGIMLACLFAYANFAWGADAPAKPSHDDLVELRGRQLQQKDAIIAEANRQVKILDDNIANINAELAKETAAPPDKVSKK